MTAYITPDHGRNEQVPMEQEGASGARSFAFRGTGNFRSFAEQSGVFLTKYFGAKTHSCIDLRLSKAAIDFSGVSEAFDQNPRAVIEILP
jgi:hypothetical protein